MPKEDKCPKCKYNTFDYVCHPHCGGCNGRSKFELYIKEVDIPACVQHEGILHKKVHLEWFCPICGKPRGNVYKTFSFDGSRRLCCDGWENPCGHTDKYDKVREEALINGLN